MRSCVLADLAFLATMSALAGCSSPPPAAAAVTPPVDLAGSSWFGTCSRLAIGTYTFDFGPTSDQAGTVRIGFPDGAQTTQTVHYTLTHTVDQTTTFTIGLTPQWHGEVTRDLAHVEMNFATGDAPGAHQCTLWRKP